MFDRLLACLCLLVDFAFSSIVLLHGFVVLSTQKLLQGSDNLKDMKNYLLQKTKHGEDIINLDIKSFAFFHQVHHQKHKYHNFLEYFLNNLLPWEFFIFSFLWVIYFYHMWGLFYNFLQNTNNFWSFYLLLGYK